MSMACRSSQSWSWLDLIHRIRMSLLLKRQRRMQNICRYSCFGDCCCPTKIVSKETSCALAHSLPSIYLFFPYLYILSAFPLKSCINAVFSVFCPGSRQYMTHPVRIRSENVNFSTQCGCQRKCHCRERNSACKIGRWRLCREIRSFTEAGWENLW